MVQSSRSPRTVLKVFCLEDNPLIVFHLEQMIEDLGHRFAGSLSSFADLQAQESEIDMDCALVDVDLTDGLSGPMALSWLIDKGAPSAFVTGQCEIAANYSDLAVGVIDKPIKKASLANILDRFEDAISS